MDPLQTQLIGLVLNFSLLLLFHRETVFFVINLWLYISEIKLLFVYYLVVLPFNVSQCNCLNLNCLVSQKADDA